MKGKKNPSAKANGGMVNSGSIVEWLKGLLDLQIRVKFAR